MDIIALLSIAFGLAADAFAVSVSNGSICRTGSKYKQALSTAGLFGLFQAAMPVLGWLLCRLGQDYSRGFEVFLAFALLAFIGGKMIYDAVKEMRTPTVNTVLEYSLAASLILALATSIDAFASGVALPAAVHANIWSEMLISVLVIGVITFFLSCLGYLIGGRLGERFSYKAEIAGGIILIILAFRVLIFK